MAKFVRRRIDPTHSIVKRSGRMNKLTLPNVTICAASDIALEATLASLERSMDLVNFGRALMFTSQPLHREPRHDISIVKIAPLSNRESYGQFILCELTRYVTTDFALIVQWDGFVIEPAAWSDDFLQFDYIGAPWTDQPPGRDVGNGGFSLRSRQLLEQGTQPWFQLSHPEDLCIAHVNRAALEERGIRIADRALARCFSREREEAGHHHFGIHGIFALAEQLPPDELDSLLRTIDSGVIGKRELLDVARICGERPSPGPSIARRCMLEYIRRFPFDLRTPTIAFDVAKIALSALQPAGKLAR